jgi:hypothetical protein
MSLDCFVTYVLDRSPEALRIPPWCRTVWDEPAKALPIPSHDLVKHVDEPRESERAKSAAERSGELDLGKHHDAPTPVTYGLFNEKPWMDDVLLNLPHVLISAAMVWIVYRPAPVRD